MPLLIAQMPTKRIKSANKPLKTCKCQKKAVVLQQEVAKIDGNDRGYVADQPRVNHKSTHL